MPVLFFSNSGLHGELLFSLLSESLPGEWEHAQVGEQKHCLKHYQAIIIDCWQITMNAEFRHLTSFVKSLVHPKILLINIPANLADLTLNQIGNKSVQLIGDANSRREDLIKNMNAAIQRKESRRQVETPDRLLTRREQEILLQLTGGESNNSIASTLHLSEHTVKNHMYNIFRKIGVKNRVQASNWAKMHLQLEQI